MTTKVPNMMANTLEKRMDDDINVFKPSEEDKKFFVSVGDSTVLVDLDQKTFVPLNRSVGTYMELKNFLKKIGLNYKSRSGK